MAKRKEPKSTPMPEGSWRDDEMFKEFSGYGATTVLEDPWSSGFNLIGGGGILTDPEDDGEDEESREMEKPSAVVFYLQELDSGEEIETRITPDDARHFAEQLNQWADDADAGGQTVDEAIEKTRKSWYDKGGIMAQST